jgi:polar amino acid transport system substrate-binding protein
VTIPTLVLAEDFPDHPQDQPMILGADYGVPGWLLRKPTGDGATGFGYEMVNEIGRRLGRPSVVIEDINFVGLFPALFAKRIEFTANPLNITAARSEEMSFSEPIMATGNAFVIRSSESMSTLDDLKGQVLAVARGSITDTWATDNEATYGFQTDRYETTPDAVQAVLTGRAFAAASEIPAMEHAAATNPAIAVGYKEYTGRFFGFAFRKGDEGYRNKVEDVLECMKLDGTLARFYQANYGKEPEADSPIVNTYPGYGTPGMLGHEDTPHEPKCD